VRAPTIEGWVYGAALHCPECATKTHGENLTDVDWCEDHEVGPVFSTAVAEMAAVNAGKLHCDTCSKAIYEWEFCDHYVRELCEWQHCDTCKTMRIWDDNSE